MNRKAFIFYGGWDGHEPEKVSNRFKRILEAESFDVICEGSMDRLNDEEFLRSMDLIIPMWTQGDIPDPYVFHLTDAIASGVGLAGCHGGMCDAFRNDTEWQFITGGQWVAHPGGDGVEYTVNICHGSSPITEGLEDFKVCSEHYYLHVDPAIEVLATTRFPVVQYYHCANKPVDMPVAWTKLWGNGRVFYTSLGHHDDVFEKSPSAAVLMERGMLWAADGRRIAREQNLTTERFENTAKMF